MFPRGLRQSRWARDILRKELARDLEVLDGKRGGTFRSWKVSWRSSQGEEGERREGTYTVLYVLKTSPSQTMSCEHSEEVSLRR